MPSCWPPVAWPSLPCSTSCSDPARRIRKTTPDVRRSPCRWTSFFCRMAGENDAPRPWPAVVRPYGRRRAHGVSVIRKKDEKERERELLREGIAAFGRDSPAGRGPRQGRTGRSKAATPGLPEPAGLRGVGRAHRTRRPALPTGRGSVAGRGRWVAASPKTGIQGRGAPLPCPMSGSAGRKPRRGLSLPLRADHATGQEARSADGRRAEDKKDDRLPRGRSSRPKREDVLMVRGYGEGGGCSCEPRQDQGGLPCRICCPPKAGRGDLRSKICLSQEGPAGARGIPGRGRSSRGLYFVERELWLKVPVKGGCCFREPGRKEEELPARYFFLPLAGISS